MKTIYLIFGTFSAVLFVLDIKYDVSPWITVLAAVGTILNVVAYFT